jgi:FtsH-binding integral membrane protein
MMSQSENRVPDIVRDAMRRVYFLTFLQTAVPGAVMAIVGLIASLFFDGLRAEVVRFSAFSVFILMFAAGFIRILIVYIKFRMNAARANRKGSI